jgi:RNA polymerase sigma factor (sigma-70 family)
MKEIELINRCIKKDSLAWNEFVKRYSGLVWWAIENRLRKWDYFYQAEDIEEIHQNVFLSLWKKNKLEQLREREKISSWLIIVSGNEAVDYFRYQKSQTPPNAVSIFEEVIQKGGALTIADILPSKERGPSCNSALMEIENMLETEINTLSAKEKIIIRLNLLYNKKYREIAMILNMPVGSVSTALKNIKALLRKRLRKLHL